MKTLLNAYVNGNFDVETNHYEWSFVIFDNCDRIVAKESGVVNNNEFYKHYALTYMDSGEKHVVGEMSAAMRATLFAAKNNAKIKLHYMHEFIKLYAEEKALPNDNCFTTAYQAFMKKHENTVMEFIHVKTYFGEKSRDIRWISDELLDSAIYYSYFVSYYKYDNLNNVASELRQATDNLVWLTKGDFDVDDLERIDRCIDAAYLCARECQEVEDGHFAWKLDGYTDILENIRILLHEA